MTRWHRLPFALASALAEGNRFPSELVQTAVAVTTGGSGFPRSSSNSKIGIEITD